MTPDFTHLVEMLVPVIKSAWSHVDTLFYSAIVYLILTACNALFKSWQESIRAERERKDSWQLKAKDAVCDLMLFINGRAADSFRKKNADGRLTKDEAQAVAAEAISLGEEQLMPMVKKFLPDEETAKTWIKIQLEAQLAKWKAGIIPPVVVPPLGSQVTTPSSVLSSGVSPSTLAVPK